MHIFEDFTIDAFVELIRPLSKSRLDEQKRLKQARYRARQIFHWVYQREVREWALMSDLSKELRAWLTEHVKFHEFKNREVRKSADGTIKVLWTLEDDRTIEGVIIFADEEASRVTACISSQVGCAMQCAFCLTGAHGYERNLKIHEIVGQIVDLKRLAPLTNIVFMGMGEPMHNLDNVVDACSLLLEQNGLNFSKRKITVSTCGVVPGIDEFGRRTDVSLAISLNGTTDEQRSSVMPVNRKWNIEALLEACRRYPLGAHRSITIEYVLLKGINDSLEDAKRLVGLLRGITCKVNLIAFNESDASEFRSPDETTVKAFQHLLVNSGMTATRRASRGRDIFAACGQLHRSR